MGSMGKKGCELCTKSARMFCESDQASLCWDCDEKVHAANFLVAKHSRTLLCHVCSSPTPWKAAGPKLGPTVSVCHGCALREGNRGASTSRRDDGCESESDGGEYYSDTDDCSEEEEEAEEEEMQEDGENQVVPWTADGSDSSVPPEAVAVAVTVTSSSSSEENASFSSSKRTRDNPFESEDEEGCCSSQDPESKLGEESDCGPAMSPLRRPVKMRRRSEERDIIPAAAGTDAIVEKLRRFQHEFAGEGNDASAMVLSFCKVARDHY